MNSTRPQCPLVPGTTFLPAHDWNTIRDIMPPMYSTPTGIRSRSSIRGSVKAVVAFVLIEGVYPLGQPYFFGRSHSKFAASFGSPLPLYFAACGYGHRGRVIFACVRSWLSNFDAIIID